MAANMFELSPEGMYLPKMFISKDEKTFQYDEELPSLPIPNLQHTLEKYLESVEPHVSKEEYKETCEIVKNFGNGVGKELDRKLQETAKYQKNWVEKWWEKYAYLTYREPHNPLVNFAGPGPYTHVWPPQQGTMVERAALAIWCTLKYWENLRKERLAIDRGGMKEKKVWSMSQFRRMFNSCKTPGEQVDQLNFYFKTEREGPVDNRVVVLHKGRIFALRVTDSEGKIFTAPELQYLFQEVVDKCKELLWGPGVGALTSHKRTEWYRAREQLIGLSPSNKENLEIIQRAIFAVALDDPEPSTYSELCHEALTGNGVNRWADKCMCFIFYGNGMVACNCDIGHQALCGDPRNHWFDKSINITFYPNGECSCNCDHAPHDAMIMVSSTLWNYLTLSKNGGKWHGSTAVRRFEPAVELEFVLDSRLYTAIEEGKDIALQWARGIDVQVSEYKGYGRKEMRRLKQHPDAFVQMALQLAYYKLYCKPAPTYETASTRQFYNARTETLRTCSNESTAFCRSMIDAQTTREERIHLLEAALKKHNQEMAECQAAMGRMLEADLKKSNQEMAECQAAMGCDRHLFGLQCVAMESGIALPEIFTHSSWKKSGGGGNYILSTSFVGYTDVFGGVAPMCKDGYGCFYAIENDIIHFFVSTWTADVSTNARMMIDSVKSALDDLRDLYTASSDQSKL